MATRRGAEKSNFSLTCSLLSQYLKEKGSFPDLSLGLNRPSESKAKQETPRTMDLLPGLESSGNNGGEAAKTGATTNAADNSPRVAQMTIFYGGRVMVLNNFPADMTKEFFTMVGRESPVTGSSVTPRDAVTLTSTSDRGVAITGGAATANVAQLPKPILASTSDLPIARRASLNRFLEKRKDRISSKAPYQLQVSTDAVPNSSSFELKKAEEKKPWLGLAPSRLEETLEMGASSH